MSDTSAAEQAKYIVDSITRIKTHIVNTHMQCIADVQENSLLSGLSPPQLHTIHVIHTHGQVALSQLASELNVSPPSASTMVDRLVEKGILIREQDVDDRRRVIISVSQGVAEEFQELQNSILSSFTKIVEKIGPKTATQWCNVLKKIQTVLNL